jgi:Rrf2 family protein
MGLTSEQLFLTPSAVWILTTESLCAIINSDFRVGIDEMRLSARERTALLAMVELARRYGDGPTALNEVAQVQGLPLPYLERVAALLRKAGLLASARGAHGGYVLTREPAAISVSEVLTAVEGALVPVGCLTKGGPRCSRESSCATRNVWEVVASCVTETLENMSLADVLN